MLLQLLYFCISLGATILGALVGLGGGVIIKPVLDSLGHYDLATINVLSSFTVLSMALVSIGKQLHNGVQLEKKRSFLISIGSIAGGIIGKSVFSLFVHLVNNNFLSTAYQAILLAILLLLILFILVKPNWFKTFDIHNAFLIVLTGIGLGFLSAFLGIGGGPINVAILMLLLNMDPKKAAIHSVLIIIFSQSAKLISIGLNPGLGFFETGMLWYMIPGGILGGLLGTLIQAKFSHNNIKTVFGLSLVLMILLNSYNAVNGFLNA